ncbi:hypothetical protein B0H14DRAFT_3437361 [Mycena olivaceomarginata]|nr:hypothetical protein B0H14DRAFT_3437361 [Mycena olivaceomarginata]
MAGYHLPIKLEKLGLHTKSRFGRRLGASSEAVITLMHSLDLVWRKGRQGEKNQHAALYDCICGHIVTLHGCKTGSKIIWLFDRIRAYYGY